MGYESSSLPKVLPLTSAVHGWTKYIATQTETRSASHLWLQRWAWEKLKHSVMIQELRIPAVPETHHRIFAQESAPALPVIHIAKSSCHWYFQSLESCNFEQHDLVETVRQGTTLSFFPAPLQIFSKNQSPVRRNKTQRLRLAVVVAGSFGQFIFQSSVLQLVKPLVTQGHLVDYYLSLTTGENTSSSAHGLNHYLTLDPIFGHSSTSDAMPQHSSIERVGSGAAWTG